MSKIEDAVKWMEDTARNNQHGYDQQYRWGERGDYDCSSAVITALQNAGIPVKTMGATYTGNMYYVLLRCGFRDVTQQVNLKTGAGLIRGDVLLNKAHHTAMYCGNGLEVEASINEKGRATGGIPGDQTGKEFFIRPYRNYPWDCVLRYIEAVERKTMEQLVQEVIDGKWGKGAERKRRLEAAGYDYNSIQAAVNKKLKANQKSIDTLAREVIAGKWGSGLARKDALEKAGYDYYTVQHRVNELMW